MNIQSYINILAILFLIMIIIIQTTILLQTKLIQTMIPTQITIIILKTTLIQTTTTIIIKTYKYKCFEAIFVPHKFLRKCGIDLTLTKSNISYINLGINNLLIMSGILEIIFL